MIQVQNQYLEQLANVPAKVPDGGDYMANMDLPPSSSEDEGDEAEEDSEDAAGRASNDLVQPEQQTAAAHLCPQDASRYAGSCTKQEGSSSPEVVPNVDHDLTPQERDEPTTPAEPGEDVVQGYSSHCRQPVEGHTQNGSNTAQDIHAVSLATSLRSTQLTQKPV